MSKNKQNNQQKGKSKFAQWEEEIADFWEQTDAFQESVDMRSEDKQYVFYDGPPFATGLPHYGHMLASTVKDSVPRFWTMRGYRVERKWGWDCHGLPIENMIEKEFGLNSRRDIEEYGIDKFNEACRSTILKYDKEWKTFVKRIGRWVDMENQYRTMDNTYMESIWWAFKEMVEKELVYKGRRVSLYCPRCATPLSNFEIAMDNSYKEVDDASLTVKFSVKGEEKTYFLAWTTTPWTLPGNVGLVVDAEADYVKVKQGDEHFYCAAQLVEKLFADAEHEVVEKLKGNNLVEREYEPLYTYMDTEGKRAYYVMAGDFVELEEGTGIVHTAAVYGEDDFRIAQENDLPIVPTLNEQGHFLESVEPWAGQFYKKAEKGISAELEERGLVFKLETYRHNYPFCWRCETPLYYYAGPAWFVNVQSIKEDMVAQNKLINWRPEHLKEGRFGKGLETAPDWNISRTRFWGTAMPVWECDQEGCDKRDVVGSVKELSEFATQDVSELDLHRPYIDEITWECGSDCDGKMNRITEVFDTWVDSGAMPFASQHYPFENKDVFEKFYPADFISEYIAQTRGWFYTLHVLSTALFGKPTFTNAVTTGTVMAEDGNKMSKSKKNYPEPQIVFDKYGVDAVRYYLLSTPIMDGEQLNFSEKEVDEIQKKYINTLWNVFTFYNMFAEKHGEDVAVIEDASEVTHALDQWVMSRLHETVETVTAGYEDYKIRQTALPLLDFVQELSTWYVRRSRDRFKGEDDADRLMALRTLKTVIMTLVKIAAPVTPFITEKIFQELRAENDIESVHHSDWPEVNTEFVHEEVVKTMEDVRAMIEKALALRAEAKIKVRQPLQSITVTGDELSIDYQNILRDELNVKEVFFSDELDLDTNITDELKQEGLLREMVRQTNSLRKKQKLSIGDTVAITIQAEDEAVLAMLEAHKEDYMRSVLASEVNIANEPQEHQVKVDGSIVTVAFS